MGDKQTTSQCKVVSNQNEHFQSQMQSETTDLFITNEVLSPTELLGQVENSFVSKYSGMLNRNL